MKRIVVIALLGLLLAACGSSGPPPTPRHVVEGTPITAAQVARTHICEAIPDRGLPPTPGKPCPSPDNAWSATYESHTVEFTRDEQDASIWLSHRGSKRVRMYESKGLACCHNVTWARPHTLVFIDDYQLFSLDPVSRRRTLIDMDSSNVVVSPNGRWLAFWNDAPHSASTVVVGSVDGTTCFGVPHLKDETDTGIGFSKDSKSVVVDRSSFDLLDEYGVGPTGTKEQRQRLAERPRGLLAFKIASVPCG